MRLLVVASAVLGLCCATPKGASPRQAAAEAPARTRVAAPPEGSTPLDLDGDGKPDAWTVAGADGRPARAAYDLDGDGAPDVIFSFEDGRLVGTALLHEMGGVPASASRFAGGHLLEREREPAAGERAPQK